MAAENQEQDKSQTATPYKLSEARKRGQVSKSIELTNAFVLAACAIVLYFSGKTLFQQWVGAFHFFFSQAHQIPLEMSAASAIEGIVIREVLNLLWPLLAVALIFSVLINMLQSGPVFTFFPLKPDPTRLNPVSGLRRVFSRKTGVEFIKILLKLSVITGILYAVFYSMIPGFAHLSRTDVYSVFGFAVDKGVRVLFMLVLALCVLALFDFGYSRWDFAHRMRMSNREVKEEHKRREGDPRIKAKLRQLRKERAKRAASMTRVPQADVVITNPTHFAVALKYERERMAVPHVWAKGS
ncbi:MAG: EscU/YscU/HrcU family type III secretion system export apparatus switch protein, partial [Gammaproteobacteria bacterium]|nr:EscU/YscU/HrcU family type III secretion system export apparatus switch protein [Gammaproteobacteria bacterium]